MNCFCLTFNLMRFLLHVNMLAYRELGKLGWLHISSIYDMDLIRKDF